MLGRYGVWKQHQKADVKGDRKMQILTVSKAMVSSSSTCVAAVGGLVGTVALAEFPDPRQDASEQMISNQQRLGQDINDSRSRLTSS